MIEMKRKELKFIAQCLDNPLYKDHDILVRIEGKLVPPENALAIYMADITVFEYLALSIKKELESKKKYKRLNK
jgi:hypothetical protein